ncbi:MAG: sel1 repeat family protein [Clostridiales bacterium]|nr:sel1 repeat family protein [Clostridiales bacterium]
MDCQEKDAQGAAYLDAGAEAYQKGDYETAIKLYWKASELGNVTALSNLGYCYYYGRSVPVDKELARKCWAQAAMSGDIAATYKLGDLYRFGDLEPNLDYSNALHRRAFALALDSEDIYTYPDAALRILQYCPETLDETEIDKRLLAQICVDAIQARIADGDHYSDGVLKKAEAILEELNRKQGSD